jgi:plastocyanin
MRRFATILVMLLGITVLAACGSSTKTSNKSANGQSETSMSHDDMGDMPGMTGTNGDRTRSVVPGAREIAVRGEALAFDPKTIDVKSGEDVTIAFTAVDAEHDFYVKDLGHVVHAKQGDSARGGLRLDKPGTYEFWCTVTGHREGGMNGTIIVA